LFHAGMTEAEALDIFRQTGALLEGHFILRSGLHSRQYFQCALALQQMPIVERLGAALAQQTRSLGAVTVISPAMGGLVIGQEVARQLGLRFIFAEKEAGALALRRGFKIAPGEKMLVVEDVIGGPFGRPSRFRSADPQSHPHAYRHVRPGPVAAGPGQPSRRRTGQQIGSSGTAPEFSAAAAGKTWFAPAD
jgi:hypothetical protein